MLIDTVWLIRAEKDVELHSMPDEGVDFVVEDEHQVTQRSFATLRMT
jgi:hypothetical protein